MTSGIDATGGLNGTASSPRRLVYVITSLTYGGAETQVLELATRFAARGCEVSVISLRPPEALTEELRAGGVAVHSLNVDSRVPTPTECMKLAALLRRLRPTLVHSHMYRANIACRLARMFANIPVLLCTAHNLSEGARTTAASGTTELVYRMTDRLCDLTTNVSHAAVDRYVRLKAAPADRIRMMPNGIDLSRFAPATADTDAGLRSELGLVGKTAILAIGRLERQKNFALLFRAFAELKDKHPDAVVLMVGQGSLEEPLKELSTELGLDDRVRFLGVRTDIPEIMRNSDIYAMSSLYEGLPIVLLEASASGLPIVATDVGGNSEIVRNEESGLVVAPESVEKLKDGLDRLLAMSKDQRTDMGRAGRDYVRAVYEIDSVVDNWADLYAELLEAKSGPSA